MRRLAVAAVLVLGVCPALGDNAIPAVPPSASAWPLAVGQGGASPAQPPNPYASAWPPAAPTQPAPDARANDAGQATWLAPADLTAAPVVVSPPVVADVSHESTWYFRQDAFYWNERLDGADFVNEYGPLSTLGYVRHSGIERYRIELFGGTVAYDGGAQFYDGTMEPYHLSFGTNYLGLRGEYDLLIEPASWSRARIVLGAGTRFWIRDLQNGVTPSGILSIGYQETWWTFYPYVGLETKLSDEPGPKFFGSVRVGATPLTYQHATYFDTNAYPRCGVTGQAELGVRLKKFSLSAFLEGMTWGQSAEVMDAYGGYSLQPASQMLTIGGKLGYTF